MWKAITYVTSGITLAAFLAAVVTLMYRRWLLQKERLIKSVPESERAALVQKTIEFFDIDTSGLSRAEKYNLALRQIEERARRFKTIATVVVIIALLGTAIAVFAMMRGTAQAISPGYVDAGFSEDLPLEKIVESVARARDVTVVFNAKCPDSVRKAIVQAGNHHGDNMKEFLENLKERIRTNGVDYSVKQTGGARYEITCP